MQASAAFKEETAEHIYLCVKERLSEREDRWRSDTLGLWIAPPSLRSSPHQAIQQQVLSRLIAVKMSPPPPETLLYLIIPLLFCWQSQMNAISTAAVSTGHISDSVDQPLQGDRQ